MPQQMGTDAHAHAGIGAPAASRGYIVPASCPRLQGSLRSTFARRRAKDTRKTIMKGYTPALATRVFAALGRFRGHAARSEHAPSSGCATMGTGLEEGSPP